MISVFGHIWKVKWNLVRIAVATWLAVVMFIDLPAARVRSAWSRLPGYDYVGEVRQLRGQGRYGEAIVVGEAGLRAGIDHYEHATLEAELQRTREEQSSWGRRAKEFGLGAVTGQGDSAEALFGAVAADFFVIGDLRDVGIEGAKYAVDGECDEVVLALSGMGMVTTVAPQVDPLVALLKAARKTGRLVGKLADEVTGVFKRARHTGDFREINSLAENGLTLARHVSPGGAIRLIGNANDIKDIERMADFVRRNGTDGAFALHATGKDGLKGLRAGSQEAERALIEAAKHGDKGVAAFRTGKWHLLRPHPVIGLAKTVYKGTSPELIGRTLARFLDRYGMILIVLCAAWITIEFGFLSNSGATTQHVAIQ